MDATLPRTYLTTHALSKLVQVHHSTIDSLIAKRRIAPAGFLEEANRTVPLFLPDVAIEIAVIVGLHPTTDDIPPAIH